MDDANRRSPPADGGGYRYLPASKRYRVITTGHPARSVVRCTCVGCGTEFVVSRIHARWCSDRCRKRASRATVR